MESKLRASMLWGLSEFFHVLDRGGRWLTSGEIRRAQYAGYLHLISYQRLAVIAFSKGECLWKVRPKMHYNTHHIDDIAKHGTNPRFRHCFLDEDFMGKLARLGKHCSKKTVSRRLLQRYLLFISQRWDRGRRCGKRPRKR